MKILIAIGTRPEAIKLAPLVLATRDAPGFDVKVCATAQHREMLDQVLGVFGITPEYDLDVMAANQTLAGLTARIMTGFDAVLAEAQPDIVVVQGDTTTTLICALAAFYRGIRVAHVEAGLRTGNRLSPFPEEANRRMASVLTDWHFAPTTTDRDALLAENYDPADIHVVGNTVLDALAISAARVRADSDAFAAKFAFLPADATMVLVTSHRRENFGEGLENICTAILALATRYPDTHIVYPVHLNPNVQGPVGARLSDRANIHLIAPQDYLDFIWLLDRARIVLTDSGGVQEEAPSLGTPVIVMRDTTERMDAIDSGTAILAGKDGDAIFAAASRLLDDDAHWQAMASTDNPFGDGHACERIVAILSRENENDGDASGVVASS